MKVKVDNFGRLLIPKRMRRQLGIKRGTTVELKEIDDHITISLPDTLPSYTHDKGLLIFTGEATGDLEAVITNERNSRDDHISGF